jgi:hypothetical protein
MTPVSLQELGLEVRLRLLKLLTSWAIKPLNSFLKNYQTANDEQTEEVT